MVVSEVKKELAAMPASAGSPSIIAQPGLFDFSKCTSEKQFTSTNPIAPKKGMQICRDDGTLIADVRDIDKGGDWITFDRPGHTPWTCSKGRTCSFDWDRRTFHIERSAMDDNGSPIVLLRFIPKS